MFIDRISIEWQSVPFTGAGHLYLVAREFGQVNDQGYAISGYPEGESTGTPEYFGTQRLEVNRSYVSGSFNNGFGTFLSNTNDFYGAGTIETDRDSLDLTAAIQSVHGPSADLDAIWTQMVQFAQELHDAQYTYDLETGGPYMVNSNSIVASVLSKIGLNVEDHLPPGPILGYPGADTILSGSGSDILQAFNGDDFIFDRGGGNDDFYGGDLLSATRLNNADGKDTIQYDGNQSVTLTIGDDFRAVNDGEGGVDALYSIETVRLNHFASGHEINYSNFTDKIIVSSFTGAQASATDNMLEEHEGEFKTGFNIYESNDGYFEAINFAKLVATQYDDIIFLRSSGIKDLIGIDAGAGDDKIDINVQGTTLFAGNGNDTIDVTGYGSVIYTGSGNDKITVGDNILIADASASDRLSYLGNILSGAGKWHHSESPWSEWSQGVRYGINGEGQLVIEDLLGRQTFVENYQSTLGGAGYNTAGIFLYEYASEAVLFFREDVSSPEYSLGGNFQVIHAMMKASMGDAYVGDVVDPLVFDLDGDGLEIVADTSIAAHHRFMREAHTRIMRSANDNAECLDARCGKIAA